MNKKTRKAWWTVAQFGTMGSMDLSTHAIKDALQQLVIFHRGDPVRNGERSGDMTIQAQDMFDRLEALGGRMVRIEDDERLYIWPGAAVSIMCNGVRRVRHVDEPEESISFGMMRYVASDDALCEKLGELMKLFEHVHRAPPTSVEVIGTGLAGYETHRVEIEATPIERGNYDRETLRHYDHVVEDLTSTKPCGRLVLMNGEPGTGKTFLVRSLLKSIRHGRTMIVPPQLVAQLDGPAFMNLMITQRATTQGPIMLVVEDADACVAKRGAGNMASISTLLNLSDGLVGSLLDLRVIATTNADTMHLDDALVRPGRLCRRLHVDKLPAAQANKIYRRLGGVGSRFGDGSAQTLAEIYCQVREDVEIDSVTATTEQQAS